MIKFAAMVMLNCLVAVTPRASVTRTVKLDVPLTVGVPLMTPVPPLNDSPGGSDPVMIDQT